ncbi:MAG: DUF1538 domain-containing protein [Treponema sp.]|jgi:hypothetical protein|nr:DUF1538 domain-containing protein [Treponema sp.]
MNQVLKEKIMEAFTSVLPITVIVLITSVVLTPVPPGTMLMFMAGAALLILGMGFFTLGVDMAMIPMGEGIGIQLTKISILALVLIISFVMGVIITVAEPDLIVLAQQVTAIPFWYLIGAVAAGVGFFLLIAVLRTLFKIRLSVLLFIFYAITFGAAWFAPRTFIPISFEAGGIATGPIVVPFIMAIGLGLASIRSDKNSQDDSFGLISLVTIGPILGMLLLGIFYQPSGMEIVTAEVREAASTRDVVKFFAIELPHYLTDVFKALGCVMICFIVFQLVSRRYKRRQLGRIAVGFFYTLIGLVFFLTGVNVGFIPVGQFVGSQLAVSPFKWVLIPFGTLVGYFIVAAEPAVHILNKQVEEISSGAITAKMMYQGLAVGMGAALAITMTRILLGIPLLWILIPGYGFALLLTFFVPKIFTGIAFDSGAVCSGPMSATFLLPLAMGTCEGLGRNPLTHAFGIVAIVAMTPLIVIQIMGLLYQFRTRQAAILTEQQAAVISRAAEGEIIDYGEITLLGEANG